MKDEINEILSRIDRRSSRICESNPFESERIAENILNDTKKLRKLIRELQVKLSWSNSEEPMGR